MREIRRTALMLAVALVGCNSIVGFDELTTPSSPKATLGGGVKDVSKGGDSGAGTVDAGSGPRCDPTKAFASPEIVTELDGALDTRTAIMTPDELAIFYLRGKTTPFQLRRAKRTSRDATWDEPVSENLSPDATLLMALTAGGGKLYYWRTGADGTKNYSATRDTAWGPGKVFVTPSVTARSAWVTKNDDAAYWAEYRDEDSGVRDKLIRRGVVTVKGVFSSDILPGIHNIEDVVDDYPVLNKQETVLYFSSTRPDGLGGPDIHVSTRADSTKPWLAPRLVTEVSSPASEYPTWVSDDDCVMLLDRNAHMMRAVRPK